MQTTGRITSKFRAAGLLSRRALLVGASLAAIAAMTPGARAEDPSGELVMLNWVSGSELDIIKELEAGFVKAYPKVTFNDVNLTGTGDMRGAIRTAIMGGQKADLLINTWPAFRKELADAGMLRKLDQQWTDLKLGDELSDAWKSLGSTDGVLYGVTYTFGDRSGIFYRTDSMKKAGIATPPATWADFTASFAKLNDAKITPIAIPAKVWSHTEWFETLLLRTGGVETAAKLAAHQIPWTDPAVKTALKKYAEMLKANCCGDVNTMLATDWDNAADNVLKAGTAGYELIGMWVNNRAKADYALTEGTDYSLFQFPALGAGHDDTSSVDSKEFVGLTSGGNPTAADAFLKWVNSAEGANIVAKRGLASPSNKVDASLYGAVQKIAVDAVNKSKVQFVLGDLLPGDLVDEYRVQLQKFLQDPSDANIDAVTAAIEAKAASAY
ncbi:MAG TPA: extracellular solute-binding protein [Arsenicitalea sp.]|jgi:multiple sugar transport system substrate-binding protein|nr:extracellular solute-binding protein [Arsenicitalea sp.]